jgi:hypothetical protein
MCDLFKFKRKAAMSGTETAGQILTMDSLVPCVDANAMAGYELATDRGSIGWLAWTHGEYRIIRSMDPSGENGAYEWHVSVSRNHRPVTNEDVLAYGRLVVPAVKEWGYFGRTESATHIYGAS